MVFSSHLFLFWFLPLALLCYYVARGKWRLVVLTVLSYLFYGWTNPLFVCLLLLSTCIDYACGLVLMGYPRMPHGGILLERGGAHSRRQKVALTVSILSNLAILAFFKYGNFGIENWNLLMRELHLSDSLLFPALHILLPLGISFYTFQSMSYTIDVYRGDAKGVTSFLEFASYVSMFPQLVAGPIIRFQEVADQIRQRTYTSVKFARGIAFFIIGMGQKLLLANPCGQMADIAFDTEGRTMLEAWMGVTSYSLQIFFDFAGYSNMAIGLGLMLGFVFPKNFDYPYRSLSITEFWRRWHISLSTWLRDYLYIPLGGNRKGAVRTYINLSLVMLLGGLWHGASWTFVIWGAIHGAALVVERLLNVRNRKPTYPLFRWGYTYLIVLLAWVFFRSDTVGEASTYILSLIGQSPVSVRATLSCAQLFSPYHLLCWGLAWVFVFKLPAAYRWTRTLTVAKWTLLFALFAVCVVSLTAQSYNPFIYFIF